MKYTEFCKVKLHIALLFYQFTFRVSTSEIKFFLDSRRIPRQTRNNQAGRTS